MSKEEVAEIITYCKEKGISYNLSFSNSYT